MPDFLTQLTVQMVGLAQHQACMETKAVVVAVPVGATQAMPAISHRVEVVMWVFNADVEVITMEEVAAVAL